MGEGVIDRYCDHLGRSTAARAFLEGLGLGLCLLLLVTLLALGSQAVTEIDVTDLRPTTLGVATVGAGIALVTLMIRTYFDVRATFWTRAEWVIDKVLSEDQASVDVGFAAAERMATMWTTSRRDKDLYADAVVIAVDAWFKPEVEPDEDEAHDVSEERGSDGPQA